MSEVLDIDPELMSGFLDESAQYLEMLDTDLMVFEKQAEAGGVSLDTEEDKELMNEMFRAAHSLKGLSAALGFDKILQLTHRMETLFDEIRMGRRVFESGTCELLFQVFDVLRELIAELTDPPDEPVAIDQALEMLDKELSDDKSDAPPPSQAGQQDSPATDASEESESADQETTKACTGIDDIAAALGDASLAQLFIETTQEALDELNQALLRLEKTPDDADLMNEIFRVAHNIKGASGAAGLEDLHHFTHQMETVLDRIRSGAASLDDDIMTALFKSVDLLRLTLDEIRSTTYAGIDSREILNLFAQWSGEPTTPEAPTGNASAQGQAGSASEESVAGGIPQDALNAMPPDQPGLLVTLSFAPDDVEAEIQAYLIYNKLTDIGNVPWACPDLENMDGNGQLLQAQFVVLTDSPAAELKEVIGAFGKGSPVVVEMPVSAGALTSAPADPQPAPVSAAKAKPQENQASPAAAAKPSAKPAAKSKTEKPGAKPAGRDRQAAKTGETLRVDVERLDQLMNLGGELVICKARFTQVFTGLKEAYDGKNMTYLVDDMAARFDRVEESLAPTDDVRTDRVGDQESLEDIRSLAADFKTVKSLIYEVHEARTAMNHFAEAVHNLERISDGIQKRIMETRMVPIGPLFVRFRRVIRDIAKSQGKKIDLQIFGEATELDKKMIDELADPLTHMVRNSVDHGLETPEDREAAGKSPTGTVKLEAFHRGNNVCIVVTDDGKGIDVERIRAKIIEREVVPAAQGEAMTEKEILQYVFHPGMSTAEKVTDLSGRGMGMDIVKTKIDDLNGTVEIETSQGKGTRVTIKLPLTLAIITSLLAKIGKGVFAIPLESVHEIVTVRKEEIQSIQKHRVIRVRDHVVPVAFFEDIFKVTSPAMATATRSNSELTLVIIGIDQQRFGLVVDQLIGQDDIVIKSLTDNFRNVRGIAGASIMGDGRVSLILDVGMMLELVGQADMEDEPVGVE